MVYTCNSCNLAFEEASHQREHMKGDWHRYNLKRRVADLPPIDEESFQTKVASTKESNEAANISKKEERRRKKEAILEQKRQILEMARRAMQQQEDSNILTDNAEVAEPVGTKAAVTAPAATSQVQNTLDDFDELTIEEQEQRLYDQKLKNRVEIPLFACLFCHPKEKAEFENIQQNIEHMTKKHGLYMPEQKYLTNEEGLIKYLGEKIGFGNVCLCCSYQGKSLEAVREHMKIKRHMRIPYESEDEKLEISEFYDFTSTYDDYVKAGDDQDGDEWEDVSGDEGEYYSDEEVPDNKSGAIIQDGYDLVLPTGKVLGHRSLQRYFKQNLPPERELSEGQGTVLAAEDRHMLNVRDQKEITVQKFAWRKEYQRYDSDDRKTARNVNYKKHFKNQLLQ